MICPIDSVSDTGLYPRVDASYVVWKASNAEWMGAEIDMTLKQMTIRYDLEGAQQVIVYDLVGEWKQ
jgi:hypothetical protein